MKTLGTFLLFISLACAKIAEAQKNYQPGFIITVDNDTLTGLINYKNWEKNPKSITFKGDANAPAQTFTVNQLDYFEVTNKDVYKSAIVWKDTRPVNLSNLGSDVSDRPVKDTVFLRGLVHSNGLSLFELTDDKTHFYIQAVNDTLQELQYNVVAQKDEPGSFYVMNTFRDQLKKYSSLNTSLAKKIEKATYNEKDLKDIIVTINQSNNTQPSLISKTEKSKIQGFLGGGISYNKISFSGERENLNGLHANPYTGYVIAAGMDAFGKRRFNNLFLRLELGYSTNEYKAAGEYYSYTLDVKPKTQYELKMNTISTRFYVNYALVRLRNARIYSGVGFGYNFSSYPTNLYVETIPSMGASYSREHYLDFEKTWGDLLGRCGYVYNNHVELNIFTRLGGTFGSFNGVRTKNSTSGLALLYRF